MEMVLIRCTKCDRLHFVEAVAKKRTCSCGQIFTVRKDTNVEIVIE